MSILEKPITSCGTDIFTQLEDIASLKDGWFDGGGTAFNAADLKIFADKFIASLNKQFPTPFIYASPDNGITLEWSIGDYEISLDVALPSQNAYYHQLNMRTNEDAEADLNLTTSSGWKDLNNKLNNIIAKVR